MSNREILLGYVDRFGRASERFGWRSSDGIGEAACGDRMPVILSGRAVERRLDPSAKDVAALTELLKPAPEDFLRAVPVSTLVNSPKNDAPECIAPIAGA